MSTIDTLNTHRIYEGKILSLRVDTLQVDHGPAVQREIVEHPGSIVVVPVTPQGTVLLVRQWRHPSRATLLEAPAGTRDAEDADSMETAQRELREEIGHGAGRLTHLGGFWLAPGWCTEYMDAFVATDLSEDALPQDDDENVVLDERPLSEIPGLIRSGAIQDAKSIAALLMALNLYPFLLPGSTEEPRESIK